MYGGKEWDKMCGAQLRKRNLQLFFYSFAMLAGKTIKTSLKSWIWTNTWNLGHLQVTWDNLDNKGAYFSQYTFYFGFKVSLRLLTLFAVCLF